MDAEAKDLLGKTVKAIYVNDSQSTLYFELSGYRSSILMLDTYADCCSETWFADIVGVEALLGNQIVGVEIRDLPDPQDGRCRQDSDAVYGFSLKTAKGVCDFVYRNSSNGYYGGSLEKIKELTELPEKLQKIETDWAA
jgi:hypothetical protein